jgi:hypothetical protein
MKILFLHGWQSLPGGVKPTFLARHRYEVINPKLPDEDFTEAVKSDQAEFDKHQLDVVVGSRALTAASAIGPTLLTPRSKASPLDDAFQGSPILPATELNRTSANRLR